MNLMPPFMLLLFVLKNRILQGKMHKGNLFRYIVLKHVYFKNMVVQCFLSQSISFYYLLWSPLFFIEPSLSTFNSWQRQLNIAVLAEQLNISLGEKSSESGSIKLFCAI